MKNVFEIATQRDMDRLLSDQSREESLKVLHKYQRDLKKLISATIRTEEMPPTERDIKILETMLFLFKKE